jgi:ABC-type nitrate/sulfonate/bicarbonate transport system ATPase subunit
VCPRSKVYAGGVRAVNALGLDIPDGDFMVFVGPSGCGKPRPFDQTSGQAMRHSHDTTTLVGSSQTPLGKKVTMDE